MEKIVVDGQSLKLYKHYFTHKKSWLEGSDRDIIFFTEYTYWLGNDGFMVRQESRKGRVEPASIDETTVDTYEFNPKIVIEAPIK